MDINQKEIPTKSLDCRTESEPANAVDERVKNDVTANNLFVNDNFKSLKF